MKRAIRVLALSLSALAAFAVILILAGVLVLDWAKGRLAANGLGAVDFAVEGLSLRRLSLSDIRFGGGREQRLERLTVFFHPTRLLRARSLDKVLIEGAELHFIPGDDGVPRLAGVSLPDTPRDKADLKMPAFPVTGLELRAGRLSLETGRGTLGIPLHGTLTQADAGAWVLDARLELHYREMRRRETRGRDARGELALRARLEPDGATRVEAVLSSAEGWLPGGLDILGTGQATVEWDGGEQFSGTGGLTAYLAGAPVVLEVRVDKTWGEGLTFALGLDASDLDLTVPDELAGFGVGLDGRASLQARLEGTLPDLSERWLEDASANGRIALQIRDGTFPGLVTEVSGDIAANLSLSGTSFLAVPASPWKVTSRLVGFDPPAGFRLSGVEEHSLRFTSRTDLARQTAAGTVGFAIESPSQPKLAGTASGRVEHTPEGGLRFDLKQLRLDPTGWTHDGMEIRLKALEARLAGTGSRIQGRVATRLDVSDAAHGSDRLTGGEVELEGGLTYTAEGLVLAVKDCVSVRAKRLEFGGVRWLRPVALCIRQTRGKPLLRLDPAQKVWSLALTLPSHPAILAVEDGQSPLEIAGTLPQAKLSATFDPTTQALDLALNTRGGYLKLAEQAVAVSDIRLALRQDRTTSVTLQHALATSLADPPDFPALVLSGKAKGRLDASIAFDLAARGRGVPLRLSAEGEHHFGLAIGELSYRLDKIRFSPQGLQPGDLVPAVGAFISEARGSLAVSGGLSWVSGVPATHVRLALHELGFDASGLSVRGINTRRRRAGRTIRNQLDTQEIRVDLLDVGIPLRNGLIRFHTREASSLRIERLSFVWGGGRIKIEPFTLRLDQLAAEHALVLTLDAIRLNPLLQLIPVDGLWGTGFLNGRVPLRILGSEVAIDRGSIRAETPGLLRYRPEKKPGFFDNNGETGLLFEALRNFHYESLSIGVNGRTHDDLQLSISLMGANPDLYDGHPLKLNFNMSGELDTIIQRSLVVSTFAEGSGSSCPAISSEGAALVRGPDPEK